METPNSKNESVPNESFSVDHTRSSSGGQESGDVVSNGQSNEPNEMATTPFEGHVANIQAPSADGADTLQKPSIQVESDSRERTTGEEDALTETLPPAEDDDNVSIQSAGDYLFTRSGIEIDSRIATTVGWSDLFDIYMKKFDLRETKQSAPISSHGEHGKTKDEPPKSRGANLIKSFVDYIHNLERRVADLEEGSTKDNDQTKSDQDTANDQDVSIDPVESVRFLNIGEGFDADGHFVATKHKEALKQKHLLTVFYTWNSTFAETSRGDPSYWPDPISVDIVALYIHSKPISRFLALDMPIEAKPDTSLRMTKPFRPLLLGLDSLRRQLDTLKSKYGHVSSAGDETNSKTDESITTDTSVSAIDDGQSQVSGREVTDDVEKEYDLPTALPHFEALVKFGDLYFADQREALGNVAAGNGDRVGFENLWMLYQPGSTIVCHSLEGGKEFPSLLPGEDTHVTRRRDVLQAYRVIATDGGRPLKKIHVQGQANNTIGDLGRQVQREAGKLFMNTTVVLASPTDTDRGQRDQYMPLYVYCFHIDTNGNKYGTVPEVFCFTPFDDQVDVRSLKAYPLQYMSPSTTLTDPPEVNGQAAQIVEADSDNSVRQKPITQELTNRGRKFMALTKVSHMTYNGLTVGDAKEEVNSALIVDIRTGFQQNEAAFEREDVIPEFEALNTFWHWHYHQVIPELSTSCSTPWCTGDDCGNDVYTRYQRKLRDQAEEQMRHCLEGFEEEASKQSVEDKVLQDYMETKGLIQLLPGVVPGFVLRNRKWVTVEVTLLEHVKQEDNWKELVLPRGYRDIVQSMVEGHSKGPLSLSIKDQIGMDLVRGKGKGCIILLHGAPGVGKTSTAECVAAYKKRPLYPITCGDIGYEPGDVEQNMEKHFMLAHKWGCVLLLDEADVFLAKRNREDVKRNGLVSVFLRILEYYSGILFLTTNRVGAIDDAFRSRLHLTLYYPSLDQSQTLRIWKSNFKQLERINQRRIDQGRGVVQYDQKRILKWAKKFWDELDWNGRQIRNAFQTAIALAEFRNRSESRSDSPKLEVEHFQNLAKASNDFNDYLHKVHGADQSKLATRDKMRADETYKLGLKSTKSFRLSDYDHSGTQSSEEEVVKKSKDKNDRSKKRSKESKSSKSKETKKKHISESETSDVSTVDSDATGSEGRSEDQPKEKKTPRSKKIG